MDVLENYKKAWDHQPEETNKVSKIDIYKMAHSRSSSIVKWIFIIGILEFVFIATINFLFRINPEEFKELNNPVGKNLIWVEAFSYIIIVYFLIRFYNNYKSISTSDDTKTLMQKILKTRKTVKLYVFINLSIVFVASLAAAYFIFPSNENVSFLVFMLSSIIVILFMLFLYWLFYQLLYGILLRKLNRNYKELAKLDELN